MSNALWLTSFPQIPSFTLDVLFDRDEANSCVGETRVSHVVHLLPYESPATFPKAPSREISHAEPVGPINFTPGLRDHGG